MGATDWLNVPGKTGRKSAQSVEDALRDSAVAPHDPNIHAPDEPTIAPPEFSRIDTPPPKIDLMGGVPITGADSIQALLYNSFNSVIINFAGRLVMQDGSLRNFFLQVKPRSDRTVVDVRIPFPDGAVAILNFTATTPNSTLTRGQCFVSTRIVSSGQIVPTLHPTVLQGSPNVVQTLIQDYIQSGHIVQWPGGLVRSSIEGEGAIVSKVPIGNSITVPPGARWRPISVEVELQTSAAVGNRFVQIEFDNTTTYFRTGSAFAHVANLVVDYFASSAPSPTANALINPQPLGLPIDLIMLAGDNIIWSVVGILAGDNLLGISVTYEEWLEPGQF